MAWHTLGWSPAFFAEIEAFPSSVLAHHYGSNLPGDELSTNGVPNLGDMTKFEEWPDYAIDLLVGGTPCQDYSVAGLRAGMDGIRGSLTLTYAAIARRYRPRWVAWENVPGVLSINGGRDFASFLGLLSGQRIEVPPGGWKSAGIVPGYHRAYGLAWRVLDAQFIRVDGFGRAVPQRRRRVFVVGYLGDWQRAAAVLLERESMRGDSAPRREAGQDVAGAVTASAGRRGGTDDPERGKLVAEAYGGGNTSGSIDVSTALTAHGQRQDFEVETFIAEIAATLPAGGNSTGGERQPGMGAETAATMLVAHAIQAGALRENPESGPDGVGVQANVAYTLEARSEVQAAQLGWAVRRLMPIECERLQGFPDKFTAVPHRGKPAADGPRYKALGNSMAVNVMRWIGQRIQMVEQIDKEAA